MLVAFVFMHMLNKNIQCCPFVKEEMTNLLLKKKLSGLTTGRKIIIHIIMVCYCGPFTENEIK